MTGLFDRLRGRAVEIHVEDHLRARLAKGDKLRVKLGLDPTAPDLHVGHLVVLDTLKLFQDEGHTVVVIIGDYTGLIGDPSGRSETRPMLTEEQIAANAETYFKQLDLVLDRSRIEVRRNSEWLATMTAADILRLLAKATLQQVLQREDFANRIKEGTAVGAHEILYPFNQAYDSVAISRVTRTDPVRQTLPRSLRSRSTIIRFSARSFALARSVSASAAVPLIGRVSTSRPSSRRNNSGDADTTATPGSASPNAHTAACGAGLRRVSAEKSAYGSGAASNVIRRVRFT